MVNPNQEDSYKKRILQNMHINEDLFYNERSSLTRNECQFHATIKTPKPSQIKVHIILPQL